MPSFTPYPAEHMCYNSFASNGYIYDKDGEQCQDGTWQLVCSRRFDTPGCRTLARLSADESTIEIVLREHNHAQELIKTKLSCPFKLIK